MVESSQAASCRVVSCHVGSINFYPIRVIVPHSTTRPQNVRIVRNLDVDAIDEHGTCSNNNDGAYSCIIPGKIVAETSEHKDNQNRGPECSFGLCNTKGTATYYYRCNTMKYNAAKILLYFKCIVHVGLLISGLHQAACGLSSPCSLLTSAVGFPV